MAMSHVRTQHVHVYEKEAMLIRDAQRHPLDTAVAESEQCLQRVKRGGGRLDLGDLRGLCVILFLGIYHDGHSENRRESLLSPALRPRCAPPLHFITTMLPPPLDCPRL